MYGNVGTKLIIIEGLSGSGKSILAHFIARQLQHNGIPAAWVHEGEQPHPILIDVGSNIERYMTDMRERWAAYVDHVKSAGEVRVVEACLFNNLIESLFAHNVDRTEIARYADELQTLIQPLEPILVYLVQKDVARALKRNFESRGQGFMDYVIRYATGTPLARRRGWEGYDGMVMFWRDFVAVTDELFQGYRIRKLRIDNSASIWDEYNRTVMECLSLSFVSEQGLSQDEAMRLVGVYKDNRSGKTFTVAYEDGDLTINLFWNVRTRLIRQTEKVFQAEGWYFKISFESDASSETSEMKIGGRDVDYLHLAGTAAEMASA